LEEKISALVRSLNHTIEAPARLAECVRRLSDFYIAHPQAETPWQESWAVVANACYFMPLNYLRSRAVLDEARRTGFPLREPILDFGAGLGGGSLLLSETLRSPVSAYDISRPLLPHLRRMVGGAPSIKVVETLQTYPFAESLGFFSYSLTELDQLPRWFSQLRGAIIIEPSLQADGRRLMAWRPEFLRQGFHIWAPCLHHEDCPLLVQSKTDWCHDRIYLDLPDWMKNIENHLPFKNSNVTFSYLLLHNENPSGVLPAKLGVARIVGDMLHEKGKARILVCRNSEREYLAWLSRHGEPPPLARGECTVIDDSWVKKGNEIRAAKN
jgi:hypothetical protein